MAQLRRTAAHCPVPPSWPRLAGWLWLLLALAGLAACSTPKQPFDAAASGGIRTIALIVGEEPAKLTVDNIGHPGMYLGAIGGLVALSAADRQGTQLTQAMAAQQLSLGAELTEAVEAALEARGYAVTRVVAPRAKPDALLDDYGGVPVGQADAILDLAIKEAGYIDPGAFSDFRPLARVLVRLVATSDQRRLYSDEIVYGWSSVWHSAIEAEPKYHFDSFDEVIGDPVRAKDGLEAGVRAVAERLADALAPH